MKTIIGIESSCDETSVAILHKGRILSNIIADQKVHAKFGGVVPEMASREHLKNIVPVFSVALKEAGIRLEQADAIAYTNGPGLLGPLLVGSSFAKGLHLSTGIPLIPVNHMEAHVLAHFIEDPLPKTPFLCLTVSGGHTQLVLLNDEKLELLGESLDDAGGEAFDKIGKMLGLEYPAGPKMDQLAKNGDPNRFSFPVIEVKGLNYSFSGLKTNVLYFLQGEMKKDKDFIHKHLDDLAASVQKTIVEILILKLEKAALTKDVKNIGIAGGVAANTGLKKAVRELAQKNSWNFHLLENQYCTDNAAMVARAGEFKLSKGEFGDLELVPSARMKI